VEEGGPQGASGAAQEARRLDVSENGCSRFRPAYRNHIWAWDFIFDRDERGGSLKWLTVIDEFTRECLELLPARHLISLDVIDRLIVLMNGRGVPANIRSDNGPELIAKAIRNWLARPGVGTLYAEPGAPWENGYAEAFQARLRDELLNAESFANLAEARPSLVCGRANTMRSGRTARSGT